jgi:hypothetical protein
VIARLRALGWQALQMQLWGLVFGLAQSEAGRKLVRNAVAHAVEAQRTGPLSPTQYAVAIWERCPEGCQCGADCGGVFLQPTSLESVR